MDIKIFCRLSSNKRLDFSSKLNIDQNNTIISRANGPFFKFNRIFKESDDVNEFHKNCLTALVNGVINGYNSSLVLFGETGSGKSYTLAGSDNNRNGLFSAIMRDTFTRLDTDERFRSTYKVSLRMFEVHDEVLVDLIQPNNSSKFTADTVVFNAAQGYEIKGMTEVDINSAAQAVVLFRDSWSHRIIYGKNDPDLQVATFVHLKLFLKNFLENAKDTVSQLSLVYLPGDENLILPTSEISGEKKRHGIFALGNLIDELSEPAGTATNYGESLITSLLEDELAGNCVTHVLLCLPANPDPDILAAQLRTMNRVAKLTNCPIINTDYARKLLHYLRTQRKELLHALNIDGLYKPRFLPLNPKSVSENLKLVQRENAELRDKIESLEHRVEKTHNSYNHAMMDRSNLSDVFIQSEEEKLRASKRIIDLEIENSKWQEKLETVRFELSNKIVYLEEKLGNMEHEKTIYVNDSKALQTITDEKRHISQLYTNLQKSYEELKKETAFIVSKNKELNLEFVNLLKKNGKISKFDLDPINAAPMLESDNERTVFRLNQDKKPLSDINGHDDASWKVRLGGLQDELLKTREIAQERLQKISKSSVDLVILKEENHQLKIRSNDITNCLKAISEEYQHCIRRYASNISNALDSSSTSDKHYNEEMTRLLKQYDSSFAVNETNLKNMLKDMRKQFESLQKWSERMVYEYMKIRQQISGERNVSVDMGPDPLDMVNDYDLPVDYSLVVGARVGARDGSSIMELRQQIKEFSNATQTNLEIERAQLLAQNAELEEQLISAQNYIDVYIKQKPVRPRK